MKKLLLSTLLGCVGLFAQQIISFEPTENLKGRFFGGGRSEIVKEHATDGEYALKVFYKGSVEDTWPDLNIPLAPTLFESNSGNNVCLFDSWHEEKTAVSLNYRIDYNVGEAGWGSVKMFPKVKGYNEILFDTTVMDGVKRIPKRLVLYRRMPRVDVTVWLDNFRLGKTKQDFKPIYYKAPTGWRQPNNAEMSRGFQLFQRNWMEHVFQNTKPQPTDAADVVLKAVACPGEAEPMTFSIHALKDFNSVTLEIASPLRNAVGEVIPAEALQVMNILCINKRPSYPSKTYYVDVPMVLDRSNKIKLSENTTKSFWIDAAIQMDAKPGLYKGTATLTCDGARYELPIALQVRSFTVPEAGDKLFGEYLTPPKVSKEKMKETVEEEFAYMRALGMTSVGICYGFDTKEFTYENGKCGVKMNEDDLFVTAMDAYVKNGYPQPVVLLSDVGQGFAGRTKKSYKAPEYKACYQAFWKAMQEECRRRGWPELIVQPVDEPAWQDAEAKERNKTLLAYLKEIPGMRAEQDGPGDDYFVNEAGPYAHVWNFNGRVGSPELMESLKKQGKLAVFYNCDVESYRTATSRYMGGFFQLVSKADGCYNWALKSYAGDVFDDLDSKNGDTTNFFPGNAAHAGGPGIGLVAFREGIDDYNYACYLNALIEKHPGPKADYARKVLDAILGSLTYSTRLRDTAEFEKTTNDAEGNSRVTGVCNIKNGWKLEDYVCAREIMARQIEILLAGDKATATAEPVALKLEKHQADISNEQETADSGKNAYSVMVPMLKVTPKIDGVLDDACWASAGVMRDFSLHVGEGKPLAQTTARILTDGECLYLGIECEEEYIDKIITNTTANQGNVFDDDCVEIFIDPAHDNRGYKQIGINALGFYTTLQGGGKDWKPELKSAATRGKDRWFVEIAIPMGELQIKGTTFGLNVCRERRPIEIFELSCWSPTGGPFAQPARFGAANLGRAWFRGASAEDVVLGKSTFYATLVNPKQDDEKVTVEAAWKLTQGKKVLDSGTSRFEIAIGKREEKIDFPTELKEVGDFEAIISVRDKSGKVQEKQTVRRTLPQPVVFDDFTSFAGDNWRARLNVHYCSPTDAALELQVAAASNPQQVFRQEVREGRQFELSVAKGAFATLDSVSVFLVEKRSGKVIYAVSKPVFAK